MFSHASTDLAYLLCRCNGWGDKPLQSDYAKQIKLTKKY